MKKTLLFLLIAALCAPLSGCGGAGAEPAKLRFSDAMDIASIEALAGKRVAITGYMSTLSPLSGSFAYLLNLPYQSCPFCVPNTAQLSNTIAVYAPEGQSLPYTEQAVRAIGTMEMGDFADEYGYTYNYRIVDAEIEAVDLSEVSDRYALWQSIASDGVVAEISAAFDYLHFVCLWTEYQGTEETDDGQSVSWFLYPGDAENFLADPGPFGYAKWSGDGAFSKLTARLRAISPTELQDLEAVLKDMEALAQYARGELAAGRYAYDGIADKYALDSAQALTERFDALYLRFSEWLGKWEL